jgi:hypothetical protein
MDYSDTIATAYTELSDAGRGIKILSASVGSFDPINDSYSASYGTLASTLSASNSTSLSVLSLHGSFSSQGIIKVGNEHIYYQSRNSDIFSSLLRGYSLDTCEASTGLEHGSGVKVNLIYDIYDGYAFEKKLDEKMVDGDKIRQDDRIVLIPSQGLAITLTKHEKILVDGKIWTIENLSPLAPGGEVIFYEARIRS